MDTVWIKAILMSTHNMYFHRENKEKRVSVYPSYLEI